MGCRVEGIGLPRRDWTRPCQTFNQSGQSIETIFQGEGNPAFCARSLGVLFRNRLHHIELSGSGDKGGNEGIEGVVAFQAGNSYLWSQLDPFSRPLREGLHQRLSDPTTGGAFVALRWEAPAPQGGRWIDLNHLPAATAFYRGVDSTRELRSAHGRDCDLVGADRQWPLAG